MEAHFVLITVFSVALDAAAIEALRQPTHLLSGSVHVHTEAGQARPQAGEAQHEPPSTQPSAHNVQVQKHSIVWKLATE